MSPRRERDQFDDAAVMERADAAHFEDDSDALHAIACELLAVIGAARGEDVAPGTFQSPLCHDTASWAEHLRDVARQERATQRNILRYGRSRGGDAA